MLPGVLNARRWAGAAILLLAACAAAPPIALLPAPAAASLDASYDWHVLLIAPFGSALKDIPLSLHEVLLFHDQERSGAAADEFECYALDEERPHFLARSPSGYLLCFRHDRLSRIEAMVQLPAEQAAQIYSDACTLWMKNDHASTEQCAGSDGGIAFSGHLESEALGPEQQLTVQLDAPDSAIRAVER
jgi:hypothetical protein